MSQRLWIQKRETNRSKHKLRPCIQNFVAQTDTPILEQLSPRHLFMFALQHGHQNGLVGHPRHEFGFLYH